MSKKVILLIVACLTIGILGKVLPHLPNFTPMLAIALFSGAFINKKWGIIVALLAMFVADIAIQMLFVAGVFPYGGFYAGQLLVYIGIAAVALIGFAMQNRVTIGTTILGALSGSLVFFILSNLGVWASSGMYPLSFSGLTACYAAAIPFFQNTLVGTLVFTPLLFGGYYAMQTSTQLQTQKV